MRSNYAKIITLPLILSFSVLCFQNCGGLSATNLKSNSAASSASSNSGSPITNPGSISVGSSAASSGSYVSAGAKCGNMPLRTTGKIYYVCDCQTLNGKGAQAGCASGQGNDNNSGLSPAQAFQTYTKARTVFSSMAAGDSIAFCSGGAWDSTADTTSWQNSNCLKDPTDITNPSSTTTCDIRDYSTTWGGGARPIISRTSGNLFAFTGSGHDQGIRILNLDLRGGGNGPSPSGGGGWGVWLYGNKTDFYICNNIFDSWEIGLDLQTNANGRVSNINIIGNQILNSTSFGFLGAASNSSVNSNYWNNNGSSYNRDHSIYLGGEEISSTNYFTTTNFQLTNNEIHAGIAMDSSAVTPGMSNGCLDNTKPCCQGPPLVVHGQWSQLNIENNFVDGGNNAGPGCWALGINDGGYPYPGFFHNVTVRRNFFQNGGNTTIQFAESPGIIIENNIVIQNQPGIAISLSSLHGAGDDIQTSTITRNNTIFFTAAASTSSSTGISASAEGNGHMIENNAIYFASKAGMCFNYISTVGIYSKIDNNLCGNFSSWTNSVSSLTSWKSSQAPFDTKSIDASGLALASIFANASATASPDFTPATSSPLIGASDVSNQPLSDYNGKVRRTTASDIGAIER